MKKFIAEFKAFIKKGNVVDLAVAVVIGAAFNKIVNSLVNDIIMPLISLMIGGDDVSDWKWIIREAQYDSTGTVIAAETALKYGIFIQAIIDFLIVALTIFFIVKIFNASRKRIEVISEKFIAETKELTKKQLKALKKISKKVKKGKIDETTAEQLAQAEGIALVETATAEPTATEVNSSESKNEESEDVKPQEVQTETKSNTEESAPTTPEAQVETSVNTDKELLQVLKEIRDYIKKC